MSNLIRLIFLQKIHLIPLALLCIIAGARIVDAREDSPKRVVRALRDLNHAIGEMEDPAREQTHQPDKVMDLLGIAKGENVADIGAGTGYFSFRLADRVGAEGRVYAVEIEDTLLEYIRTKMESKNVSNIIPVKSGKMSPNLPEGTCDTILVVDTYNYFAEPVVFMKSVHKALKPGGQVAIINRYDFKRSKGTKKNIVRLAFVNEVIEEMKEAGFVLRQSNEVLKERYFLVFQRN